MKPVDLRICLTNAGRFGLPIAEWEARGLNVECVECLAQCGDCEAGPFAEANGTLVFTETLAELAARIKALEEGPLETQARE